MENRTITLEVTVEPTSIYECMHLDHDTLGINRIHEIMGNIFIEYDSLILTKSPKSSDTHIRDGCISIILKLHEKLPFLLYPSKIEIDENIFGIQFVHHRYGLLFISGHIYFYHENRPNELIGGMMIDGLEWGDCLQKATQSLIDQVLAIEPSLKDHDIVKILRSHYTMTELLLLEYRKNVIR
jgi:hypothetical protein